MVVSHHVVVGDLNSGPLGEQSVLLTSKPSLQPEIQSLDDGLPNIHFYDFAHKFSYILCNDISLKMLPAPKYIYSSLGDHYKGSGKFHVTAETVQIPFYKSASLK
ncbi:hypothetical protein STEG23_007476, partial [Scotinomys teguina]